MNSTAELTTSELAILESLQGATEAVSQRELARRSGLSVGLVNAVLKKLVHTGYVKTGRLDRRSLEYLLTPLGFAQTALRSYHYIINTVRGFRAIQSRLHDLVARLHDEGCSDFFLYGESELAELVALFFEDEGLGRINRGLPPEGAVPAHAVLLNAEPRPVKFSGIQVVELLSEFHGAPVVAGKKRRAAEAANAKKPRSRKPREARETAAAKDKYETITEFYGLKRPTIEEDKE